MFSNQPRSTKESDGLTISMICHGWRHHPVNTNMEAIEKHPDYSKVSECLREGKSVQLYPPKSVWESNRDGPIETRGKLVIDPEPVNNWWQFWKWLHF
jgi:hypothetical protein